MPLRPSPSSLLPIRIPTLSLPAHPPAPYLSLADSVSRVADFLEEGKGKTVVLTGAGISVDSGIRAYRGKGGSVSTKLGRSDAVLADTVASYSTLCEPHHVLK